MSSELLKEGAVVKLNKNLELSKDIYCHDFNPIKYFDMVGTFQNSYSRGQGGWCSIVYQE